MSAFSYNKSHTHVRTQTIRFLDYWLGIPACALLTAVRRLQRERRVAPRRIMFVKFIEQGATVLAQDAIRRATARVGRDNIFFCVFESNRAILDVLDVVPEANVLRIRDRRFATFLLDFIRALITMRAQRIDTIIDMEFFSRASAVFAFLSGASTRVGLHRFTGELPYRGDLMTHRIQYTPHLHVSLLYVVLLEAAFGDHTDEPLLKVPVAQIDDGVFRGAAFEPTTAETAQMRALVGGTADDAHPVILLNPNASDLLPLRKWESAKFVELGRRLLIRVSAIAAGRDRRARGASRRGPAVPRDRFAARGLGGGTDVVARTVDVVYARECAGHQ